ncbi:A/G-specific adenine glycosylase [Polaromonas eurypsychrophila]|uniref:Adenine DNA glycosylase n=1 Tax=Polaromonas eurypsychrophila TaxID=1614635 RepID=A0A916WFY4_9BURK|nr:A/G-specific adenine glycosylase [Polaromonas eurypsychrophila]GGA95566.1 A/G-specific adenine glycosylase [Polaromonas eurypsychrophila]
MALTRTRRLGSSSLSSRKTSFADRSEPAGVTAALTPAFSTQLVRWQKSHGRHSLPWQNTRDPYRVWLSEIMLQQTQVATVLDYYTRFLQCFPAVADLAAAKSDEVLGLWSGLGYYSRARNLHRCAQDVVRLHGGQFPQTAELLQTLPGIGPSTAAAIASFCFSERVAILDGNVKRVLTRLTAFSGDLASSAQERALLGIATELLPRRKLLEDMPRYTQGIMDLGASICTSRQPSCLLCPVQGLCLGLAGGAPETYPVKTRKLKRSAMSLSLLWAERSDGAVWLERRPTTGIWGGLYCFPVFASEDELLGALPAAQQNNLQATPPFVHVLTHKDLRLSPMRLALPARQADTLRLPGDGAWLARDAWTALGLPAPIRKLLG